MATGRWRRVVLKLSGEAFADPATGFGIHGARTGYDLLKSPVCIPPLDRGLSALLDDLQQRGGFLAHR